MLNKHLLCQATFLVLAILAPLTSQALTKAKFPDNYQSPTPSKTYEFEEFRFYKQGEHLLSKDKSTLPNHEPFLTFTRFHKTLHTSTDPSAIKPWFDVWNTNTERGVNAFRKVPIMHLVAYWKTPKAWAILFSFSDQRDQSLIPMFISLSDPPVFITDATDLGDFVGAVGQFLKLNPDGFIESVDQ
jgi:hypothetical protein